MTTSDGSTASYYELPAGCTELQDLISYRNLNAPDRTPLAKLDSTHPVFECGETVLIAACRAIVAAKLGESVQVPAELVEVRGNE